MKTQTSKPVTLTQLLATLLILTGAALPQTLAWAETYDDYDVEKYDKIYRDITRRIQELEAQITELDKELTYLRTETDTKKSVRANELNRLQVLRQDKLNLEREIFELEKEIKDSRERMRDLVDKKRDLERQHQLKVERIKRERDGMDEAGRRLDTANRSIDEKRKAAKATEQTVDQKKTALQNARTAKDRNKDAIDVEQAQLTTIQGKIDALQAKLAQADKKIDDALAAVDVAKNAEQEAGRKVNQAQNQVGKAQTDVNNDQADLTNRQQAAQPALAKIKQSETALAQEKADLASATTSMAAKQKELDAANASLAKEKSDLAALEATKAKIATELGTAEKNHQTLVTKIATLEAEIEELEKQIEIEKKKGDGGESKRLTLEKNRKIHEVRTAKAGLPDALARVNHYKATVVRNQTEIDKATQEVTVATAKSNQAGLAVQEELRKVDAAKAKVALAETALAEARREGKQLTDAVDAAKAKLSQSQGALAQAQTLLNTALSNQTQAQKNTENAKTAVEVARTDKRQNQEQLETSKALLGQTRDKIKALRDKATELEQAAAAAKTDLDTAEAAHRVSTEAVKVAEEAARPRQEEYNRAKAIFDREVDEGKAIKREIDETEDRLAKNAERIERSDRRREHCIRDIDKIEKEVVFVILPNLKKLSEDIKDLEDRAFRAQDARDRIVKDVANTQVNQGRARDNLERVTKNLDNGVRNAKADGAVDAADGVKAGSRLGRDDGAESGKSIGIRNGKNDGDTIAGKSLGKREGEAFWPGEGSRKGDEDGKTKGRDAGREEGYQNGLKTGRANGEAKGREAGLALKPYETERPLAVEKERAQANLRAESDPNGKQKGTSQADSEYFGAELKKVQLSNKKKLGFFRDEDSRTFANIDWEKSPEYRPRKTYVHPAMNKAYLDTYREIFIKNAGNEYEREFGPAYTDAFDRYYRETKAEYERPDFAGVRTSAYEAARKQAYEDARVALYGPAYNKAYAPAFDAARKAHLLERVADGEKDGYNEKFDFTLNETVKREKEKAQADAAKQVREQEYPVILETVRKKAYEARVAFFKTNAVVKATGSILVDGNADMVFAPGEAVAITTLVKNFGEVATQDQELSVEVSGLSNGLSAMTLSEGLVAIPGTSEATITEVGSLQIKADAMIGQEQSATVKIKRGTEVLDSRTLKLTVAYPYVITKTELNPRLVVPGQEVTVQVTVKNVSAKASANAVTLNLRSLDGRAKVVTGSAEFKGINANDSQIGKVSFVAEASDTYEDLRFDLTVVEDGKLLGQKELSTDTSKKWKYQDSAEALVLVSNRREGASLETVIKGTDLVYDIWDLDLEGELTAEVVKKYLGKTLIIPSADSTAQRQTIQTVQGYLEAGGKVYLGNGEAPRASELSRMIVDYAEKTHPRLGASDMAVYHANYFLYKKPRSVVVVGYDVISNVIKQPVTRLFQFRALTTPTHHKLQAYLKASDETASIHRAALLFDLIREMNDDAAVNANSESIGQGQMFATEASRKKTRLNLVVTTALAQAVGSKERKRLIGLVPDLDRARQSVSNVGTDGGLFPTTRQAHIATTMKALTDAYNAER